MLNHIVLMGRLTRDPELRYTQNNIPVASFTLAVDRDFGSRDGGEKQTDFIDCVAWRSTAEFVSKWFAKGRMAVVSGRLQTRKYTDREGNNRTAFEVVVDNMYFGESKRDNAGQGSYSQPYSQAEPYSPAPMQDSYTAPVKPSDFQVQDDDDGDLPF
ncbi:MAG: single-stranded DNA-binding protein [Oscillospiraceae bacterium]|nr:single-stranded DNA-binding protein [Oscillospiraceae bacterium]